MSINRGQLLTALNLNNAYLSKTSVSPQSVVGPVTFNSGITTNGTVVGTTFQGNLVGNASTATKLATGRTISLTGDITGSSTAFDGSANVSFSTTLANTTVSPGSYGSASQVATFNVDSKGRLTSAASVNISINTSAISGGTLAVARGGTGTATAFTSGSIVFAGSSGVYSQDNNNFFWDNNNKRLGIGTKTPTEKLEISGNIKLSGTINTVDILALNNAFYDHDHDSIYVTKSGDTMTGNLYFSGAASYIGTSTNHDFYVRRNNTNRLRIADTYVRSYVNFIPNENNSLSLGTSGLTWSSVFANAYYIGSTRKDENWDTAYTERRQWDGGSTNLNVSTARTSLGLTGDSNTTHYHDGRYYTKTQLSTSGGGGSVHWNNVDSKPDATNAVKGIVLLSTNNSSTYQSDRVDYHGQMSNVARQDHFHTGLQEVIGAGVIEGLAVSPSGGNNKVTVSPGIAILRDGARVHIKNPIELTMSIDATYTTWAVVFVDGTRKMNLSGEITNDQVGVMRLDPSPGSANALPNLNSQHPGAIPLAKVRLPAGAAAINQSHIVDIREFCQIRRVSDKVSIYKKYEYIHTNESQTTIREEALSVGADGDISTYGDLQVYGIGIFSGGIATGNPAGDTVDISAKYKSWDQSATFRHEHIYNEVLSRNSSTKYFTSYVPAQDTKKDNSNNQINQAMYKISIFRNGQLLRPSVVTVNGSSVTVVEQHDYYVLNNEVTFHDTVDSDEVIMANYEVIPEAVS